MIDFCSKQRILKSTEIPNVIINHIPIIERVTYFKFLGVIIDSNLTWSHHINHISNKLSRICGVLSRLKHYVPVLILKIIYNRRFPRSMRSQGKRCGCGSRQARRPRWRFRRIVVSRGNVDASLFQIKIRFFLGHQREYFSICNVIGT